MRTIISACIVAFLFFCPDGDLARAQQVETYDSGTYSEIFELNPPAVFSIVNGQGLNGTRAIQPLDMPYTINYLRKWPLDLSGPSASLEISTFFKVSKPTSTNLAVDTLQLGFDTDQNATPGHTGNITWHLEPEDTIDTGSGFRFETWVSVEMSDGNTGHGFSWSTSGFIVLKSNNWYRATLQISRVNSTTLSLWGTIDDYGPTGQTYLSRVDTVGTSTATGSADHPFTRFTADSTMYPALRGMSSGGLQVVDQTAIMGAASPGGAVLAWTQASAPASSNWNSVASSADGRKLVAVILGGGIYTSSDFGTNWTKTTAPNKGWWSVASSTNGNFLFAVVRTGTGGIWVSSNSGLSWAQTTAPSGYPPFWNSLACSADGSHVVAARDCACFPSVPSGDIWTSSNFGATWSQVAEPNTNTDVFVTLSADGRYLFAASFHDTSSIYVSTTFGATWAQTTAPTKYWDSIASSADGRHLLAAAGSIYTSTDFAATWMRTSAPSNSNWAGVASSADGSRLIGVRFSFGISTSTDSGSTWTSNNAPSGSWRSVASSADGMRRVAVQEPGGIYTASWWATVTLGSLSQTYDGSGRSATATTSPSGLTVNFTYNGSPNAPTNVGSYAVIGTVNDPNYQGSATGTLVINPPAPVITTQPQSQTVAVGANVGFNVVVEGLPPFAYQWAFNGTNLSGETRSLLNLVNVQLANAGYYQVRVTNVSGWAFSLVANLSVIAPLTNSVGFVGAPVGLVDWWPAEGNANDMAGPNNGTPTNTVSYVPGRVGFAFGFDGATTTISVGASNIPPPWTACFWVNRENAPRSSAALTTGGGYALKLEQFNLTRKVGITAYGVADYAFNYIAPLATWVHLVFVGTGSNTLLYANGGFQDSLPVNIPLPRAYIGAIFHQTTGAFFDCMQGSLDEISLFNRALSASEIQYIFSAGNAGLYVGPGPVVQLEIIQQGGNVQLSWPVVYSNYNLLGSAALTAGAWITNSSPRTISGSNIKVTLPATSSRMFYRLAPGQ